MTLIFSIIVHIFWSREVEEPQPLLRVSEKVPAPLTPIGALSAPSPFTLSVRNLLSVEQLNIEDLRAVFSLAEKYKMVRFGFVYFF